MREVNFNKQMRQAYATYRYAYTNTHQQTLSDCYKSASGAKWQAYHQCLDIFRKYNGYDFTIIGYNYHFFSVGFCYNDKQQQKHFVWITPYYNRDCIIGE